LSREGPTVLHLLAPAPYGGLETVVRHLARAQAEAGARVHVAAVLEPSPEVHPFVEALRSDGLDVQVLAVPGRAYGRERAAVGRLLTDLEADVLHTHGYRPDVVDAPVARAAGVATVTTVHGFTGNTLRNRVYEWVQRRAFRRFDAVLAVSAPMVEGLTRAGVAPERVHLVRNAWRADAPPLGRREARERLGLDPGLPGVVGIVGRVSAEKGPDVAIRALAEPDLAGAHLVFVGDGRDIGAYRTLAESVGVGARIVWAGRAAEAGRLMAAFDVLCLPSHTEGTPVVLFEADAASVPVVASGVGGVPDVLGGGWNLVPADDPPALARALALALGDRAAAEEAVGRARARIASEFAPVAWAAAHLAIYESLRSTGRRATGQGVALDRAPR
jgi:glycosyltransferase involved in cell wall biosynthesis